MFSVSSKTEFLLKDSSCSVHCSMTDFPIEKDSAVVCLV